MDKMSVYMKSYEEFMKKNVLSFLEIPAVSTILAFLVVINLQITMEEFPDKMRQILKNYYYRIFITVVSLYANTKSIYTSVGLTFALFTTIFLFDKAKEGFELIYPSFNSSPGCLDIKIKDLMDFFEGDAVKLKKAMYSANVPLNLQMKDEDAPLIATYLIQTHKYPMIGEKCGKI